MNNNLSNTNLNNEYLSGTSLGKSLFKTKTKHLVCMVSNTSDEDAVENENLTLIVGYEETEESFYFISDDNSKWSCAVPVSSKNNQPLYIKTEG